MALPQWQNQPKFSFQSEMASGEFDSIYSFHLYWLFYFLFFFFSKGMYYGTVTSLAVLYYKVNHNKFWKQNNILTGSDEKLIIILSIDGGGVRGTIPSIILNFLCFLFFFIFNYYYYFYVYLCLNIVIAYMLPNFKNHIRWDTWSI